MSGLRQKLALHARIPLHALPAFEVAARHESFRAAASELHLTPSAISHQIRALEGAVGVALFQRLPRGLRLTEAGRKYARVVAEVLLRLEREADEIGRAAAPSRLRVSMPDFVARYWVLPALARFRSRHPRVDLDVSTSMALADLEAGEADAAIRLGSGKWGQLHSHRITGFSGTVVAAPRLAAQARSLSERGELPMVCVRGIEEQTRRDLGEVGLVAPRELTLRVDNYLDARQAAEEGLGVTVLYGPPAAPFQSNEHLVALSGRPCAAPFAMYFVCRPRDAERPEMVALRDWFSERAGSLVSEAEPLPAAVLGRAPARSRRRSSAAR